MAPTGIQNFVAKSLKKKSASFFLTVQLDSVLVWMAVPRTQKRQHFIIFGKFVSRYPECRTQYRQWHIYMHEARNRGIRMHFEFYCIFGTAATAAISIRTCIKFVHCHFVTWWKIPFPFRVCVKQNFHCCGRYGCVCIVSPFRLIVCPRSTYILNWHKHMHSVQTMAYPYSHYLLPSFARQTIDSRAGTTVQLYN